MTKKEFGEKFKNLVAQMHDIREEYKCEKNEVDVPAFFILYTEDPKGATIASAVASSIQLEMMMRAFLQTNFKYIVPISDAIDEAKKHVMINYFADMFTAEDCDQD